MNNEQISYAQFLVGNNNKLVCGIDTAIKALRPSARYDMSASGGAAARAVQQGHAQNGDPLPSHRK